MVTLLLLALCQDDKFQELRTLRALVRGKSAEAASLRLQAHLALDRGDFNSSVSHARIAKSLQQESAKFRERMDATLEAAVGAVVADLDSPDIDFRDRASRRLIELGPEAMALL